MSEERDRLNIRHILVALDASPSSIAALEAAADIAARFGAELQGLFVQDTNLLRLASLPFVHEVSFFSATRRRVDSEKVELHLRAQTRRVRHVFTTMVERTEVRATFRVTRGMILQEVLSAASSADLVVLGKGKRSPIRRGRLGSTARTLICEAPALTLILEEGGRIEPPVMVVYDGSPLGDRALVTAVGMIEEEKEEPLVVLLLALELDVARKLREQAAERLREWEIKPIYHALTVGSVPGLVRELRKEDGGMLVLPASCSLLESEALLELVDRSNVPVLLVR